MPRSNREKDDVRGRGLDHAPPSDFDVQLCTQCKTRQPPRHRVRHTHTQAAWNIRTHSVHLRKRVGRGGVINYFDRVRVVYGAGVRSICRSARTAVESSDAGKGGVCVYSERGRELTRAQRPIECGEIAVRRATRRVHGVPAGSTRKSSTKVIPQ